MLEAPDVTPDMYNPVVDDDDWNDFLRAFNMPLDTTEGQEEDDEDEEYVFQVNEDEEVEREEFRGGPGAMISRKEVSSLMKELFQDVSDLQHQTEVPSVKRRHVPLPDQSAAEPPPPTPLAVMSSRQARLLDFQMTAHVQLLAQTYVLCAEQPWLAAERAGAATLLVELNTLSRSLRSDDPTQSFFYPPNLAPALQLCADWDRIPTEQLTGPGASKVFKGQKRYCRFSQRLVDTVLDSKAFVFASMLPATVPLVLHPQAKPSISIHLDHLIAMGLEQFMPYANAFLTKGRPSLNSVYKLISKHMIPLPARRIKTRVDWVRWTRMVNNPIYVYFDQFRAPPLEPKLLVPKYPLVTMRNRWGAKLPEPWRTLHGRRRTDTALYFTVGAKNCSHLLQYEKVFQKVPRHVVARKKVGQPRSPALPRSPQPKKRPVKVAVSGIGIVSGHGARRLSCPNLSSSSSESDSEYETDYDDPRYEDPDGICYDHEQGEEDWAAGRSLVSAHSWPEAPIQAPAKPRKRKRKVRTRKVPAASTSEQAQSVEPTPSAERCRVDPPVATQTPLTPVSPNSRKKIISRRPRQSLCSTNKENNSPESAEQSALRLGDTLSAGQTNEYTGSCELSGQRCGAGQDILAMCMPTITDSLPGTVSDSVDMPESATPQEAVEQSGVASEGDQGHLCFPLNEEQRGLLSRRNTLVVTGSDIDNPRSMPDFSTVWNVTERPIMGSNLLLPASSSEPENVISHRIKDANGSVDQENTNVVGRSGSPASDGGTLATSSNGVTEQPEPASVTVCKDNSQTDSHAAGSSATKTPGDVTSTIELKEEEGQLVMYIRTTNPDRPEVRVPVRAAAGAARLTLPPSLALSGLGRAHPPTSRATGVVAPTVREPPAQLQHGGPAGSPPAQLEPRSASEPSSPASAPASPAQHLAGQPLLYQHSQCCSLDGGLFKLPLAPLRSVRRTAHPPAVVFNQSCMGSTVESGGTNAAGEPVVSDAAPPPAGGLEPAASPATNADANSRPSQVPSAAAEDDSQSVSLPWMSSWSQSPPQASRELQFPAMMPPALMTPGRGSPQQQLCLSFPTPLETPAVRGPDLSDLQTPLPLRTPQHGALDTPLMLPSPARQSMLETPLVPRSPAPEVRTPPRQSVGQTPVPPQDAGSADAGSHAEKRFFQQVGKDVKSKPPEPAVSEGKPGPELMSEQSLGGILEQLLVRPGTEHQEVPEHDAAPGSSAAESRKLALHVPEPVTSESASLSADVRQAAPSEPVSAVAAVVSSAEAGCSAPAEEPAPAANTEALPLETAGAALADAATAGLPRTAPSQAPPPSNARAAKTAAASRIRTRSESASPAQKNASGTTASACGAAKAAVKKTEEEGETKAELKAEETALQADLQTEEGRESSAQPMVSAATAPPAGRGRSKRTRQQWEAELTQLALAPESLPDHSNFAFNFHQRVKESTESIDPAIYEQFSKLLAAFSEAGPAGDQLALYDGARRLLRGFPELLDEFLGMLDPQVAVERDCVVEHLRANHTTQLVRRIENVHAAHPMQIQKALLPARIIDISSAETTEASHATAAAVDPTVSPPSKRARRKPPAAKGDKAKKSSGSGAAGGAVTPKVSNTGTVTSKVSNTGTVTSKASNTGTVMSKASNTGTVTSKASNTGTVMSKASNTGTVMSKTSGSVSGDCASAGGANIQASACAASLDEPSWSREEDLEILTSCQKSGDGEKTFRTIQRKLPQRSLQQLQQRFQHLIEMLREQLQAAGEEV